MLAKKYARFDSMKYFHDVDVYDKNLMYVIDDHNKNVFQCGKYVGSNNSWKLLVLGFPKHSAFAFTATQKSDTNEGIHTIW